MDKKEEIGKLYALRAGLSVIAQKHDDYNQNEIDCSELQDFLNNQDIFKSEGEVVDNYNNTIQEIENNKNNAKTKIEEAEANLEKAQAEFKKAKRKVAIFFSVFCITFPFIVIWAIIFYIQATNKNSILSRYRVCEAEYHNAKRDYEKSVSNNDRINNSYEKDIALAEQVRDNNFVKLAEYKEKEKETLQEISELESQLVIIRKETRIIEDTLLKEFKDMLDSRDWENLDLIIYYYETGRADSIKEALQLVDVERRNNELVYSIQRASEEMCSSIENNVKYLGKVLNIGFNSLSALLNKQRIQTVNELKKINKNVSEIWYGQMFSNALLEKATLSSRELVKQMREINRKIPY